MKGFDPLINNTSTPRIVGPGRYIEKNIPKTSEIE